MSMTNFTAADMPGSNARAAAPAPVPAKPVMVEKKAKDAPKVKEAPKAAEAPVKSEVDQVPSGPDQTDTETHGVGPSTVEGQAVEAAEAEAEADEDAK